jgi:hypothetical protein
MRSLDFGRFALSSCAAAAMLAGCGGSQPPIGVPGGMPQTLAIATHADRGKSWMLPEAKSEDLVYISDGYGVTVYAYPGLKLVGSLTGFDKYASLGNLCTDSRGDIFVPSWLTNHAGYIYEFAHGGTSPIATLDDPGGGEGCSVDPTTGNLAVANIVAPNPPYYHGNVVIYPNAEGSPTTYTTPYISFYEWAAYDNKGDLFVDGNGVDASGFPLAELPFGASSFSDITLNEELNPYSLQWNDGHLIIASNGDSPQGPTYLYQVKIANDYGTIVRTTDLHSRHDENGANGEQFWIQGGRVIGPGSKGIVLEIWKYPAGGSAIKKLKNVNTGGTVVSLAPSR